MMMMIWYESRPKSDFEDAKSEKLIALLSSLNSFGIVLSKKDSALSLYLGAEESESHHIATLPDVTSVQCEAPVVPLHVSSMKFKNNYIHPLCVVPEPCKIYEQSSTLPDFTFGVVGKRIDPKMIRRKAKSFIDKISKRSTVQVEMTKPIEWKLEQNSFFAVSIFFACEKERVPAFLSSVNFTNRLSEPNALLVKSSSKKGMFALNTPKLSWLGGVSSKTPVLSSVELVSVLSLPPAMFGLEMESGADKTFSNLRGTIDDPADFFVDMFDKK